MIERYMFVTLNARGAMMTALPEGTWGLVIACPRDTGGMFYRVYFPDTTTGLWYLNDTEFDATD